MNYLSRCIKNYIAITILGISSLVFGGSTSIDEVNQALQDRFYSTKNKNIQTKQIDVNLFGVQVFYLNSPKKMTNAFVVRVNEYGSLDILGDISFFNEAQQRIGQCFDTAVLDTVCTDFAANGQKIKSTTLSNGMKNGWETTYKADGNINTETFYVDNQKSGPYRFYITPDSIKEEHYQNGVLHGKSFTLTENTISDEAVYQQGELVYLTMYHPNQQLMMIRYYAQGQATKYLHFYQNGQKKIEEINPKLPDTQANTQQSYELRKWYPNGQIAVENIENKKGELVTERYWDKHGNRLTQAPSATNFMK